MKPAMPQRERWHRPCVLLLGVVSVAAGCKREPRDHSAALGSAMRALPSETIAITAALEGAAPDAIERDVVIPLEAAVAQVANVTSIRCIAAAGRGVVIVDAGRADALTAVREAVRDNLRRLPEPLEPPLIQRGDPDAPALMSLALTSTGTALDRSDFARRELVPRLEQLAGVASVALTGAVEPAVVVRLDVAKLAALRVTVADVQTALAQAVTVPAAGGDAAPHELATLAAVELARRDASVIRLGDVAQIEAGAAARPEAALAARSELASGPLHLTIRAQPGADPVQVVAAVRAAGLAARLLPGWSLVEAPAPDEARPRAIAIVIHGPDWDVLGSVAGAIEHGVRKRGDLFTAVTSDLRPGVPERALVPDGDAAVRLGVAPAELATTLRGLRVGPGRFGRARQATIELRFGAHDVLEPEDLAQLQIRGVRGQLVPLSSVVAMTARLSPTLTRRDRERAITISADLMRGQTRATVEPTLVHLFEALPAGYHANVLPPPAGSSAPAGHSSQ